MEHLTSWPVIGGLLVAFFLVLFYRPICGILGRVNSVKGPLGLHLEGSEPSQQAAIAAPPKPEPIPAEQLGSPPIMSLFEPIEAEARQRIERSVPDPKYHLDWALRLYADAIVHRDHETTYRSIFGSQIRALRFLSDSGGRADRARLYELYVAAKTQFEDQYSAFPFEAWLGFLVTRGLIEEHANNVLLTQRGYAFLSAMPLLGMSDQKGL